MGISPDFNGLTGIGQLETIIGALLTFVLILAVLIAVSCAITWGLATSAANPHAANKARTGVLVACGTAGLAGAGVAWMNWLITLGTTL